MEHNKKIKNKNIGYFLVGKMVFSCLSKAEKYCNENNLDVDKDIISGDDEIKKEAKNICSNTLPSLYNIKKSMQELFDNQLKIAHRKMDQFEESKKTRDLLRDYYKDEVERAYGELQGISKTREIIRHQIENYENIMYL